MKLSSALIFFLLPFLVLSCENPSSNDDENTPPSVPPEWSEVDLGSVYPRDLFPHPGKPGVVFLGGYNLDATDLYVFLRSSDWGQSWDTLITGRQVLAVAFCPSDPDLMFANAVLYDEVSSPAWLLVSQDGGDTWAKRGESQVDRSSVLWIDPADINHLWNGWGSQEEMYGFAESCDGGLTWTDVLPEMFSAEVASAPYRVSALYFKADDPAVIYAGCVNKQGYGQALRTEDDFSSITVIRESEEPLGFGFTLNEDDSNRMTVTERNRISYSEDGGSTWTVFNHPDDEAVSFDGKSAWIGDSVYVSMDAVVWALNVNDGIWNLNRDFSDQMMIAFLEAVADESLYLFYVSKNSLFIYR